MCVKFIQDHLITIWASAAPQNLPEVDPAAYDHFQRSRIIIRLKAAAEKIRQVEIMRKYRVFRDHTKLSSEGPRHAVDLARLVSVLPYLGQLLRVEPPEHVASAMSHEDRVFMPSSSISSRTVERICGNVVVLPGTAPRAGDVYHA